MSAINLTQARVRLGKLIDRVEAGDEIAITRRGKPVALLTAVIQPRRPVELAALQGLTASVPDETASGGDLVRAMRDDDRY